MGEGRKIMMGEDFSHLYDKFIKEKLFNPSFRSYPPLLPPF